MSGVVDFALDLALVKTVLSEEEVVFVHGLIARLLLEARIPEARRLLVEVLSPVTGGYSAGLSGWLALIEGRQEEAAGLLRGGSEGTAPAAAQTHPVLQRLCCPLLSPRATAQRGCGQPRPGWGVF